MFLYGLIVSLHDLHHFLAPKVGSISYIKKKKSQALGIYRTNTIIWLVVVHSWSPLFFQQVLSDVRYQQGQSRHVCQATCVVSGNKTMSYKRTSVQPHLASQQQRWAVWQPHVSIKAGDVCNYTWSLCFYDLRIRSKVLYINPVYQGNFAQLLMWNYTGNFLKRTQLKNMFILKQV